MSSIPDIDYGTITLNILEEELIELKSQLDVARKQLTRSKKVAEIHTERYQVYLRIYRKHKSK